MDNFNNSLMFLISYAIALILSFVLPPPHGATLCFALILYSATIYLGHIIKSK